MFYVGSRGDNKVLYGALSVEQAYAWCDREYGVGRHESYGGHQYEYISPPDRNGFCRELTIGSAERLRSFGIDVKEHDWEFAGTTVDATPPINTVQCRDCGIQAFYKNGDRDMMWCQEQSNQGIRRVSVPWRCPPVV